MDYTGVLYHGVEKLLGEVVTREAGNAIKTAIEIVVRQTKLASIGIRVELEPVPA